MPTQSWKQLQQAAAAEQRSFAPLEANTDFNFIINDAAKVSKTSKGLPRFTINPSVESGPRAKARIFHDFNLTENAGVNQRYFFEPLQALGLGSIFDSEPEPTMEQVAAAFQGRRFIATTYTEDGTDGKTYIKLKNIRPATAPVQGGPAGPGAPVAATAGLPAATAAAPSDPWASVNTAKAEAPQAASTPFGGSATPPPPVF